MNLNENSNCVFISHFYWSLGWKVMGYQDYVFLCYTRGGKIVANLSFLRRSLCSFASNGI